MQKRDGDGSSGKAYLVPLAGPGLEAIALEPRMGGVAIGRHAQCEIQLPAGEERVSRFHARFTCEQKEGTGGAGSGAGAQWYLVDLNSRWGTFVNGCRVEAAKAVPLHEGDLIRITPWTFSFRRRDGSAGRGVMLADDLGQMQTLVRVVGGGGSGSKPQQQPAAAGALAEDMVAVLLEAAAGIHAAPDEQALAQVVLQEACRGSGLPNAALLRPLDAGGRIEVIATRAAVAGGAGSGAGAMYSRSLVATASNGVVSEFVPSAMGGTTVINTSESIVQMHIDAAICVPLMLGSTVAAYLYLDSRSSGAAGAGAMRRPSLLKPNASAFCLALGRMASLALANLKRVDMERRQAAMEAELSAAAVAQKWILPPREGRRGAFAYVGESRPGQYVGGDFFDVIELDESRTAVALGDVSGKGVSASVLMTATQGFLHAALHEHGQVDRAVTDLNRFLHPRRPAHRFVTLWVGLFDARERTLRYVDAGHGYAVLAHADGTYELLREGNGLPVGPYPEDPYEAAVVSLREGDRVLVVSDGIIEQPVAAGEDSGSAPARQAFDMVGVLAVLQETGGQQPGDEIARLFQAVVAHAGTTALADDATAVLVREAI